MAKIVIIGGGWSGIAAAVRARKQGADVTVAEKTDLLLGLGNVGGIMRNNGRYTAAEENIAPVSYTHLKSLSCKSRRAPLAVHAPSHNCHIRQ